jgi:5-formyltetrahydrofolate cyclo-ligase
MVKNKIRKSLFEQGQSISNESKNKLGLQIQKHALEIIDTRDIDNIALYFPFRNEVNTNILVKAFTNLHKNIYMPKVLDETNMAFNLLCNKSKFSINRFGIKELDNTDYIDINNIDLMFIPMVGVDPNGCRLGYGSGYYDRIVSSFDERSIKPLLVGLAFEYQVFEMHFGEMHDLKYNLVFSENDEMFSYLKD